MLRALCDEAADLLLWLDDDGGPTYANPAALRAVSQQIAPAVRSSDLVGRYGGGEFVVLLPETDVATASQVAERLRAAVAARPIAQQQRTEQQIAITVSIGVAEAQGADQALYAAKAAGRSRVVVAEEQRPVTVADRPGS